MMDRFGTFTKIDGELVHWSPEYRRWQRQNGTLVPSRHDHETKGILQDAPQAPQTPQTPPTATKTLVVGGTSGLGKVIAKRMGAVALSKRTGHDVLDEELVLPDSDNLVFCLRYRGADAQIQWETEYFGPNRLVPAWVAADSYHPSALSPRQRSIVFVSSVAARTVSYQEPLAYHASKAAIEAMVRYYAVLYGPVGVRVNAVAPGAVLKEENSEWYRAGGLQKKLENMIPLRRMTTAEDVAAVVEFLCGEGARAIT